jgi:hypothetical protein
VLGIYAGLVAVTGIAVSGAARSRRLGQVLVRLQDTTAEIRVRFAVLLLVAFTVLAERFGLESILGAFLAGAIVGLVDRDSSSHPSFRTKLDAIGYGFLVPVFFVSSGIRLDLTGLLHSPSASAASGSSRWPAVTGRPWSRWTTSSAGSPSPSPITRPGCPSARTPLPSPPGRSPGPITPTSSGRPGSTATRPTRTRRSPPFATACSSPA